MLLIPITISILSCIIIYLFHKSSFYKNVSLLKKVLFVLTTSTVLSCIANVLLNRFAYIIDKNLFLKGFIPVILFLILSALGILALVRLILILNALISKDNEIKILTNKIIHKNNMIAKLRSQKHDYLRHLQVVSSLLNTGLNEDAQNYIVNIANSFRSKTSRYGKVSYLDAICALKYEECLLKGISFDSYIQDFIDNLSIEPDEMSSLLLNILDNGIEALSSIHKDKKYIKLSIYEDEFQYVISIINNGPMIYDTNRIFLEGYSSRDGENRGYGLYSVKQILDKYNYHIFVESDEYITEFTTLIPKY